MQIAIAPHNGAHTIPYYIGIISNMQAQIIGKGKSFCHFVIICNV